MSPLTTKLWYSEIIKHCIAVKLNELYMDILFPMDIHIPMDNTGGKKASKRNQKILIVLFHHIIIKIKNRQTKRHCRETYYKEKQGGNVKIIQDSGKKNVIGTILGFLRNW